MENIENKILDRLNEEQKKSVLHFNTSTRIIAGPGTGKTTTIIAKIAYLIFVKNVNPKEVLVITFTNKAKEEIIERMKEFTDDERMLPMIFTYHSFASWFLRIEFSNQEKNQDFKIFDYTEQIRIVKKIQKENFQLQNISPNDFLSSMNDIEDEEILENTPAIEKTKIKLNKKYKDYKQENNGFDFDDLLIETRNLLRENPEVAKKYQERFLNVFVDEFQDTNDIQFEILRLLTTKKSNLTIVGDPDQNLYSWRGANIDLILNFDQYFDNVKTFILSENYRSIPEILTVAKKVIKNNKNRIHNELFTRNVNKTNFKIKINEFASAPIEANFIAKKISCLITEEKYNFGDFAIIYRSNYISKEFEKSFIENNIPYKVIGGFKFYDRKEIKELFSLLGFLLLDDNYYFEITSQVPPKGIGAVTLDKIIKYSRENNLSYFEATKEVASGKKINEYIKTVEKYRALLNKGKIISIKKYFTNFLKEIYFFKYYEDDGNRIENLHEALLELDKQLDLENLVPSFVQYLQKVSLTSSADTESSNEMVTLITSHSSKGTEFKVVFVVGLIEGVFPTWNALNDSGNFLKSIEEERRSFYVAITRAKEKLFLTFSKGFDFNGRRKNESSFLNNLGLEKERLYSGIFFQQKEDNSYQMKQEDYFKDNSKITTGSVVYHRDYHKGVVLEDMGNYVKVAFDKNIGIKILIKNNKALEVYEK